MDLVSLDQSLGDDNAARSQLAIAEDEIGKINGAGPGREQFFRLRSLIRLNAGDLDGALADIDQALAIDSHDRDNLQLDGDILMKLGHTAEAIGLYKQILTGQPDNRLALTSLGYALPGRRARTRMRRNASSVWPRPILHRTSPIWRSATSTHPRRNTQQAQSAYTQGLCAEPAEPAHRCGGHDCRNRIARFPARRKMVDPRNRGHAVNSQRFSAKRNDT